MYIHCNNTVNSNVWTCTKEVHIEQPLDRYIVHGYSVYIVHGVKMFTFIELKGFRKRRAELIEDDEFREMQQALIVNPELGNVIQDTGGFRKLRWARPGTGKSGGVRVIYYNRSAVSGKLYLALIYAKNEADNITSKQKAMLKQVAEQLS